jgi:cobalamin biosynthesis protein CobC
MWLPKSMDEPFPGTEEPDPFLAHGGRLSMARRHFPGAPSPWLDLSTGISPYAYPLPAPCVEGFAASLAPLPDLDKALALQQAARQAYGAAPGLPVATGPGTEALIRALPRLIPPRPVGILGPTYSSHAKAWQAAGHSVETVTDPADLRRFCVCVIVRPDNPSGRLLARDHVRDLTGNGRFLVLDEAFIDDTPQDSLLPLLHDWPDSLVFRSFGKFFGLAGLRIGFAFGTHPCLQLLADCFGDWPVSGPALDIGIAALSDLTWQSAQRKRHEQACEALDKVLRKAGVNLSGGTRLFRSARHPQARLLFRHLAEQGILTRAFAHDPSLLRFGLPADLQGCERMAEALASSSGLPD